MNWTNLNRLFNAVADEQGVEPGSREWDHAGVASYSGRTGPHGSYGWRHDHRVDPDFARAVVANYCHRGIFYMGEGARWRMFGYEQGGRPRGWTPEDPQDLPNGHRAFLTSTGVVPVSGPDLEHLWLEPLWALIDGPEVTVRCLGKDVPASWVARIVAAFHVASAIGMIRQPGTNEAFPWGWGDRSSARLLSTIDHALRRGCMTPEDAETALSWIKHGFLSIYTTGPGVQEFKPSPEGRFRTSAYNGLHWLIPALWDITRKEGGLPRSDVKERLRDVLTQRCNWAHDLEKLGTRPGDGFRVESYTLPLGLTEPPESIANIVDDVVYGAYEVWSFRSCAIAAQVTASLKTEKAEEAIMEEHVGNPEHRAWMVGADREYVEA